jgi:hypothetical protein
MIEINLLPEELKKKKRAAPKIDIANISLENIPVIKIALVVAVIFIAIQIMVFGFGILGSIVFKSFEKSYKEILPGKQSAEQLSLAVSKMSKKVSAIDELMVRRFSWAKKLNDLSDSVTAGIWLTQLEYDEHLTERPKAAAVNTPQNRGSEEKKATTEKVLERYLVISGASQSMGEEGTALIGRFIKNLKENVSFYSDFSDIELGSIKRERLGGQEIMTFKITCLFKIK